MSPKDLLAELLFRSGVIGRFAKPANDQLIVFGYHRIRPDVDGFETPFDDGVYGPTVSRFRDQMLWLKAHTKILSEAQLVELVESGRPLPGASSFITFDDGYRDNYTLALPVLRELGIPATFFIPTNLIAARHLGWWDLIAYFLKKTQKSSISVDGREHLLGEHRTRAIEFFCDAMKLRPAGETRDLLAKLPDACDVRAPSAAVQDAELMSWDELREAVAQGIAIGSHSHTHRVLTTLDRSSVDQELQISKTILETETGFQVRALAYPCGGHQHFDDLARQAAAGAGYRLAFSFNTGVNRWGSCESFAIPRLGASERPSRLAAITVFPRFFAWRD